MQETMAETMMLIEPDLVSMEQWTAWVARLMHAAAEVATTTADQAELAGAAEDADVLGRRLRRAGEGWYDDDELSRLVSIYELWDANCGRFERRAEQVDPSGFREWSLRSVGARPSGYGVPGLLATA